MQLGRCVNICLLAAACSRTPCVLGFVLRKSTSTNFRGCVDTSRISHTPEGVAGSCGVACSAKAKHDEPSDARGSPDGIGSPLRRHLVASSFSASGLLLAPSCGAGMTVPGGARIVQVTDPDTYSALSYSPPEQANGMREPLLPLIVVLPGAGKNDRDAWDLADPNGEHRGLAPSLLASGRAPPELARNFAVVTPYAAGRQSFYDEPRGKILRFVEWVCSEEGIQAGCPKNVDPRRIFLFGFSDGATLGVELATSGRFRGGVFAAYGFTGTLPPLALERLKNWPVWVFHCADDVIFPVACSDRLVNSLEKVNTKDAVRYTRYDRDQEGFTGSVKGHSSGITASKQPDIYTWMLAQ